MFGYLIELFNESFMPAPKHPEGVGKFLIQVLGPVP